MRIAVVNAWGMNRGDEAMQRALIAGLQSVAGAPEVAVFANSHVDLPPHVRTFGWNAIWPQGRRKGLLDLVGPTRGQIASPNSRPTAGADLFRTADLVISAPAGPYIGDSYVRDERLCLLNIWAAARLAIPCVITATSAGAFRNQWRNSLRRRVLRSVEWWSIREPISYQAAADLLGSDEKLEPVADLVFTRTNDDLEPISSSFEADDLESLLTFCSEPTIGVSISVTAHLGPDGQWRNYDSGSYLATMGAFLDHVSRSTGCNLLLFPHFYGEPFEMRELLKLAQGLDTGHRLRIVPPYLNSDAHMRLISKLSAYISNRYHPTIFALQMGTPAFCIIHQFKAQGMLDLFEYPHSMPHTYADSSEWIRSFDAFWDERAALQSHVGARLPKVREQAQRTINRLKTTIERISRNGASAQRPKAAS